MDAACGLSCIDFAGLTAPCSLNVPCAAADVTSWGKTSKDKVETVWGVARAWESMNLIVFWRRGWQL
eukprot:365468-Chlamydomonas_euryale.AAC.13